LLPSIWEFLKTLRDYSVVSVKYHPRENNQPPRRAAQLTDGVVVILSRRLGVEKSCGTCSICNILLYDNNLRQNQNPVCTKSVPFFENLTADDVESLQAIINRWRELSPAVKQSILLLVNASQRE
jgi:hypothetical protein